MNDPITSKALRPRVARIFLRWLLAISLVGVVFACGARMGKIDLPLGVTITVFPVSSDSLKPIEETYPHTALQLFAGGRPLSFSEDFELVVLGAQSAAKPLARYKSSDLATAVRDTHCAAQVATLAGDNRAVFCDARVPFAKASMFLLVKPDGSTQVASSPSGDERDADAGVRHLALSF
jgi:hypothetical protein